MVHVISDPPLEIMWAAIILASIGNAISWLFRPLAGNTDQANSFQYSNHVIFDNVYKIQIEK